MSKGGMQTSVCHPTIICPVCGKPAARMEGTLNVERYMHFTKNGTKWHELYKNRMEVQDET